MKKVYFIFIILSILHFSANAQDNLFISKSITTVPVKPGDPIVYEIYYSNLNTSGTANNIVIKDFLPSSDQFTYSSSTGVFDNAARTITWSGLSLAAGTSGTLTIRGVCGKMGGPAGLYDASSYYISTGGSTQSISNNASIQDPTLSSPLYINTPISVTVQEYCGATIPTTATGYIKSATNAQIYYLLTVTNTGNITDKFTLNSNNPGTGQSIPSYLETVDGTAITQTPWLQPGSSYSFVARFKNNPGTVQGTTNNTIITATSYVCGTNNSTNITTNVYGGQPAASSSCDLQVTNTASANPITAGNDLAYTITVVNNSAAQNASNVLVIDTLPSNVSLVSYSASSGVTISSPSSNKIVALKSSLSNTDNPIVITVTVTPNCMAVPSINNYAVVSTSTPDSNATNDQVNITTSVASNITSPTVNGTTICSGNSTSLTASGTLTNPGYKWYSASTGGTALYTGNIYTTPSLPASTTYYASTYDLGSPSCESSRTPVTVAVLVSPVISTQPADKTVCAGNNAAFNVVASGTFLSYQWQVNTGSGFTNVSNTGVYSGSTTTSLTITAATAAMNNYSYRCLVKSGTCATATSNSALLILSIPTITGTLSVCAGSTTQLTGSGTAAASSPWTSSATGVATVSNTGLVTGVSSGTATITYTNSNGCSITATVTVNTKPTITGALNVCAGSTTQLTGSGTAATSSPWTSSATGVATVSNTGLVTGVSSGTTIITYTNNNGCSITAIITVNALPAITGTLNVCASSTIQLIGSGTASASSPWTSSATGVATVSNAGLVTGVSSGTTIITYTNNNGCSITATVTVNTKPTITGTLNVCAGSTIQLIGSGTASASSPWTSSATGVATVSNTGLVTGVSSGTAIITYTNNNGCSITATVTVNAKPAITGTLSVCAGSTTQLTGSGTAAASSPWTSSVTSVATVSNTGLVTGVSSGTTTITYTNSNGCSITATVTVNSFPTLDSLTQAAPSCEGSLTINLMGLVSGSTNTISYSIGGVAQTPVTVIANISGYGSFSTPGLTTTDNGKILSVTGITCSSGCYASFSSKNITLNVKATGTWLGINADWNDSQNWCGGIPASNSDITVPVLAPGLFYPVISQNYSIHNLAVSSGASLTLTEAVLQISGAITNNGTFNVSNGTIEMIGSTSQSIPANSFQNNSLKNLIISNTSVAGVTLGGPLNLYGSLTYTGSGKIFYTNDNLTLKSTSTGTAWVGNMTGNTISGKVTVERYISAQKAWRFLSIPTNTGQTIQQTWQEGCGADSSCITGFGTLITGPGGTAAGFDAYSPNPSMKTYSPATNAWVGISNTRSNIKATDGYMTFIRGDRTVITSTATSTQTVLRTKGNLYVGDQPSIIVTASKFAAIGNPYASALDMRNIIKTGIKDFFYVWDPQLAGGSGYGGYQTFSNTGSGNYVITPGGGSYGASGSISNYIQSGQAFFVQGTATGGNLTFKEAAKASGSSLAFVPETLPQPQLRVNLYGVSADTSSYLSDGFLVNYGDDYSNLVDDLDAFKSSNSSENLSVKRGSNLLVIERRHTINSTDTIFFNLANASVRKYRFEISSDQLYQPGLAGYLIDNYLHTSTPLHIDGTTLIDFNIANIAGSYAANRFEIVFSELGALPVTFTSVKANHQDSNILVEWKVENQSDIKKYEVEKSGDGNHFSTIATITANNDATTNYSWVDTNPYEGYNYYRIRSIDISEKAAYSQIVTVQQDKDIKQDITIFPNPIANGIINLKFINQPKGVYHIRIINQLGKPVLVRQIICNEEISLNTVQLDNTLAHGIYQVAITKPDGTQKIIKVIF